MAQVTGVAQRNRKGTERETDGCEVRLLKEPASGVARAFSRNAEWLSEHIEQIRDDARYQDRYVAIDECEVISARKDLHDLIRVVEKRVPESLRDRVVIRHISAQPRAMIL